MPLLHPTYALTIGALQTSSDRPVAGITQLVVERDMDTPGDGLRLWLADRADIQVGEAVALQLGHDGDNAEVFTGTVVMVRPTLTGVQVQSLGRLNALATTYTAQFYDNQTAGQIARDLIQQAGLTPGTVDTGPTLPRYGVDRRLSVHQHLRRLAQRLGYELYGDRAGKVNFHGLGAAASLDSLGGGLGGALGGIAALATGGTGLAFGQHLIRAQSTRRTSAVGQVVVGGESPMSRQGDPTAHWLSTSASTHQGSAGTGQPQWLVIDGIARTRDLADRVAAGLKATADRTTAQIQVRLLGQPQIDLGDTVQTQAAPDTAINGQGYVRSLRHSFGTDSGFTTDLVLAAEEQ